MPTIEPGRPDSVAYMFYILSQQGKTDVDTKQVRHDPLVQIARKLRVVIRNSCFVSFREDLRRCHTVCMTQLQKETTEMAVLTFKGARCRLCRKAFMCYLCAF